MPSLAPFFAYLDCHVVFRARLQFISLQVSINPLLESYWWTGGFRVSCVEFLDLIRASYEVFGRVPGVIRVISHPTDLVLKSASVGTTSKDLVHGPLKLIVDGGWGFRFSDLSR